MRRQEQEGQEQRLVAHLPKRAGQLDPDAH